MRWTINKKLILGFLVISLLIGVAGVLGLLNVLEIKKAADIISYEEIPISNAVSKMYSSLLMNKNLIEMYKGATSTIPVYNEEILIELEENFQNNVNTFNSYADAILNGSTINGHAVLPTRNPELREIIKNTILQQQLPKFQTTAKDVMKNGKEMLTQKDLADYSMKRMEGLYEHIRSLLDELDEHFAKEAQFEDYFKDLNKTIITTLIEARINLGDIAHYSTMNIIVDIKNSFEARLSKFDSWLSRIHNQEEKIENGELKDIIKTLSHEYLEFKQVSRGLIAARKELVNIKNRSDNAIKRLDEARENILLILMKAAGEAEKGVKTAQATINATQISAKFVLVLTAGIGTISGIIFGILSSRQITNKLKLLVETTQIISAEDMGHKVAVSSRDEIGTLAISFNKMIADLQKTTVSKHKLEKVVKERTRELKTSYNQLILAEKLNATGKLAASIAHEFNNPIYGIRNVLERVADRASDGNLDETHKDLVGLAIKECNQVSNLIQKLQDFHRPSSGIATPFNIHDAINDMIRINKKKLKEKKIKLETHYAEEIPPIVAVSDQIKQVILNLIQNAEGASNEEDGNITISTELVGSDVKIHVRDNGCGIPLENIKSIFEPFFTTKTKGTVKGTGLGLSVSYGIIKKHNGDIGIQSQPGKGTTFTITLPTKGVS